MSWLLGAALLVLLVVGYWWLKRPIYYKDVPLAGVERFVSDLLQYFADGSILLVEHSGSPRFVQFVKYLDNKGRPSLHFSFPAAEWSVPYFAGVAAALKVEGIPYRIRDTTESLCPRFLDVDEISESQVAFSIAQAALSAMGLRASDTFRIHFLGYHSPGAVKNYVSTQMAKRRDI